MATTTSVIVNGNGTASLPATTQKDPPVQRLAEEPLNLAGIAARRAKAGKLIAGTAAYSDSDMFKSPVCCVFL